MKMELKDFCFCFTPLTSTASSVPSFSIMALAT